MSVSDKQLKMSVSVAWEPPDPSEWREWGEVVGSEWFFDVNSRAEQMLELGLQALRDSLTIYDKAFVVDSSGVGGLSETRASRAAPYGGPQFKKDAREAIGKFELLLGVNTETPEDRGNKHGRSGTEIVAPPAQRVPGSGLMLRREVDPNWLGT